MCAVLLAAALEAIAAGIRCGTIGRGRDFGSVLIVSVAQALNAAVGPVRPRVRQHE
jgi:hypothetical protein